MSTTTRTGRNSYRIELFLAEDGDRWFSVICSATGDLATGEIHDSREAAQAEIDDLDQSAK